MAKWLIFHQSTSFCIVFLSHYLMRVEVEWKIQMKEEKRNLPIKFMNGITIFHIFINFFIQSQTEVCFNIAHLWLLFIYVFVVVVDGHKSFWFEISIFLPLCLFIFFHFFIFCVLFDENKKKNSRKLWQSFFSRFVSVDFGWIFQYIYRKDQDLTIFHYFICSFLYLDVCVCALRLNMHTHLQSA